MVHVHTLTDPLIHLSLLSLTTGNITGTTGSLATIGHPADGVVISGGPGTTTGATTTTTTNAVDPAATGAHHSHHHGHHHNAAAKTADPHAHKPISNNAATGVTGAEDTTGTDRIVKTGDYVTGLEHHAVNPTPIPVVGNSHQNRITGLPQETGPAPRVNAGPLHTTAGGAPVGVSGPLGGAVVLGGQCECLLNGGTCKHGAGQCRCRGCATPATTVNPGQNIGVSDTVDHTATNPHPLN